ncbi:unnamed protein product [Pseudo-nitzschia multistriata]|uniref:Uncharacterized protein n=1 Tax=Pseudo-nitzschia multistriata TaxID=183589 RepID=A0A448ZR25_9STRA|nr:unnamed protein product [Pseudo-nitzschia multistriata]
MGMYHNANLWCWIAAAPACPYDQEPHQIDNWQHYEEKADKCEESKYDDDVDVYRLAFYFGPLWLCMVFITVTMGMLICAVSRIGCSKKSIASCLNRHKNSRQKANTDSRKHENDSVEEQSEGDEQSNSSISGAGDAFKRQKANSNSRNHENNSDEEQNGGDEQSNISISGARDAFKSDRRSSFFIPAKKKKRKTPRNENTTHVLKVLESYLTASQQAKNSQSYGSRVVYKQAIYYTLAFYATFTFATINRVFQHFGVSFFPFILLHSFTIPLQGFFNLVIYRYFHFVRLRQRNPYVPFRILLQWTFRWTFLGPPPGARRDSSQKFQSFELPNNGKSTKSRSFGPSGAFDSHNCEYSEGSDSVVDDDAELERMPRIEDEFENSFWFDYTPSAELAYEYHTTRALNNPAQYPSTLNNVPTQYPTMVTDFDSDD